MSGLALLARADDGGIAAQSYGFFRNLRPRKVLVCHTGHTTRGTSKPQRFTAAWTETRTCRRAPDRADIEWLLQDVDTVLSVECWYGRLIPQLAAAFGVRTVLQANPEMSGKDEEADVILAPTDWRLDALPDHAQVLPFPTDLELLPLRDFEIPVKTLYHIHSEAMEDRNGTDALLAACELVKTPCRLVIRGGHGPGLQRVGAVSVTRLAHYEGWFYEAWPPGIDAFVLPRRYGGLCLPLLEAASLGLPIIATDLQPQRSWLPFQSLVPCTSSRQVEMRGGIFKVHDPDIPRLATTIEELLHNHSRAQYMADRAHAWAHGISWPNMLPEYEEVLGVDLPAGAVQD